MQRQRQTTFKKSSKVGWRSGQRASTSLWAARRCSHSWMTSTCRPKTRTDRNLRSNSSACGSTMGSGTTDRGRLSNTSGYVNCILIWMADSMWNATRNQLRRRDLKLICIILSILFVMFRGDEKCSTSSMSNFFYFLVTFQSSWNSVMKLISLHLEPWVQLLKNSQHKTWNMPLKTWKSSGYICN